MKTAGGHHRIPEPELDKFLHRVSARLPVSERRPNFRRISVRNQLVGGIVEIKTSGLMAQVRISIGGQHITSVITADAAAAIIKSTEVMIRSCKFQETL
jgi:molybdopterin-binding protein